MKQLIIAIMLLGSVAHANKHEEKIDSLFTKIDAHNLYIDINDTTYKILDLEKKGWDYKSKCDVLESVYSEQNKFATVIPACVALGFQKYE